MTESKYITDSKNYASQAQSEYENSLSYLLDDLTASQDLDEAAMNERYNNLINEIRQQLPELQEQFETGAKAAYINKQQSLQQINSDLSRLGVETQGFGVTQRLQNETAYGQNYNQLQLDLNAGLRDVANQETNALGDLNADLAELDAAYSKEETTVKQYISEQGQAKYESAYSKMYNDLQYQEALKQQAWENEQAEKQRQEALKQQAWENAFAEKQRQDSLAQQAFENSITKQQLALQQSSLDATKKTEEVEEYNNYQYTQNTKSNAYFHNDKAATSFANEVAMAAYSNGGIIDRSDLEYLIEYGINNKTITEDQAAQIMSNFTLTSK